MRSELMRFACNPRLFVFPWPVSMRLQGTSVAIELRERLLQRR